MGVHILTGDCRDILPTLPEKSVHCCVTSPPYWGLRDYGVDGQIGLEASPEEYISEMVQVFREVHRVLRDDGTLWLNLGDTYAGARGQGSRGIVTTSETTTLQGGSCLRGGGKNLSSMTTASRRRDNTPIPRSDVVVAGLKPKDMCGIPWRVAHARRGYKTPDGWDTSAGDGGHGSFHKAGREKGQAGYNKKHPGCGPKTAPAGSGIKSNESFSAAIVDLVTSRNKRSVWTVPTQAYSAAHFATFPEKLIEPCIKAGCPPGGTVLDLFGGSGTTGLVATRLRRNSILIDLNQEYVALQHKRTSGVQIELFG